jgi:hypothetical protein
MGTRIIREGTKAVIYFLENGVKVKDFFKVGADADEKTYDLTKEKIDVNKRYKICLINRFLVLDIDRKNGKDGLKNFYETFNRELLPDYLKDIENGSYPFYMRTTNNGYHLYFKFQEECRAGIICDGVEIKIYQSSAGYKEKKPYVLYGNIDDAKMLPGKIIEKIQSKNIRQYTEQNIKNFKRGEKKPYDKIKEYVKKDRPDKIGNGRNQEAFFTALRCKFHNYTEEETLDCLINDKDVNTLPRTELEKTIKSAYKYEKRTI